MALAFLCAVSVLFVAVLIIEGGFADKELALRPAGLLNWLMAGNWTAKLGALLLTIGTGALLRYLMLHVQVPAADKLLAGVAITAILGIASGALAVHSQRRAISLALGGAALAVAYLTAYSAYGYFNFLASVQALGLLFLVASVGTVLAIARRSLSIAVLAMVGAYIAPAFALSTATPVSVYGYYIAASSVTLMMVWLRGWRPLIHLSFLFTLGGALFFAWTQAFYTPDHYSQMQPLLLALVALHLAMPLVEGAWPTAHRSDSVWVRRFDEGYFLLLPVTAAVLTLLIAPAVSREGALGLSGLALLWFAAAGAQQLRFAQGALRYLAVAALLLVMAGLLATTDVPLFLIAGLAMCALIIVAERLALTDGSVALIAVVALATSACYTLRSLFASVTGIPLLNLPAIENLLLAAALLGAGRALQRRASFLSVIFFTYGTTWLVAALLRELLRLQFTHLSEIAYVALLSALAICCGIAKWRPHIANPVSLAIFGVGLIATGLASAAQFAAALVTPLILAGQILYSLLALQADRAEVERESAGAIARSALPLLLWPWALAFNHQLATPDDDVIWTLLVCSALWASLQARWWVPQTRTWPNWLSPVGFLLFGILLFYETLLHIERTPWAVAFELIGLIYLVETARFLASHRNPDARVFGYVAVAAAASVSAAMLLRLIGPPGTMTILDLNNMLWPAFVSLLWAAIGAVLTWLSIRNRSRTLWSLGAVLLVAAAAKLILWDFGSLGQIGNIIAMMAAGGVFLLVAWLAPFPPRHEPEPSSRQRQPESPQIDSVAKGRSWIWVLIAVMAVIGYARWIRQPHRPEPAVAYAAPPAAVAPTVPMPSAPPLPAVTAPRPSENLCALFASHLPDDYLVYGAAVTQATADSTPATIAGPALIPVEVQIEDGDRNIVLELSAEVPTLWSIQLPGAGRVVGVILSGARRSEVAGLGRSIPVLHTATDDEGPCAHPVDTAFTVVGNRVLMGQPPGAVATPVPSAPALREYHVAEATQLSQPLILSARYRSARNGQSFDVAAKVRAQCNGQDNCMIICGNQLGGDPDFGWPKQCEIEYRCNARVTHVLQMREGSRMGMSCP